jgi:hypothetical protein
MAQTVYQVWMMKPSEAWYQLSSEEQASLMNKVGESLEKAGGKNMFSADSSWSSEEWLYFGVNEYPDIEAAQKNAKGLTELNWFRYIESKVILGTKFEQV